MTPRRVTKYKRPELKRSRESQLMRNYGLTAEDYLNQHELQDGRCGLCGVYADRLGVDHCHTTGKIRGILCSGCNSRLGAVEKGHRPAAPAEAFYLLQPSPFPHAVGFLDDTPSTFGLSAKRQGVSGEQLMTMAEKRLHARPWSAQWIAKCALGVWKVPSTG